MELSVVLISWNSERYVADCLDALVTACEGLERELIWVDNGSTDRTRAILESYLSRENILLIPLTQNLGVARARNLGIQRSTGKMVLLLDVDTRITREALRAMIDYLAYHPDCGMCGCKLYDEQGDVQMSCRRYPSLRYKIFNVLERFTDAAWVRELNRSQFYAERMAGDTPFEVEYIIGACQLIRRELIERIGLLDGHIFYGPEDADFCLRANKAGWKVCYLPNVSFLHAYQRMTGKRLFSRMSWIHVKSLVYFFFKHLRI